MVCIPSGSHALCSNGIYPSCQCLSDQFAVGVFIASRFSSHVMSYLSLLCLSLLCLSLICLSLSLFLLPPSFQTALKRLALPHKAPLDHVGLTGPVPRTLAPSLASPPPRTCATTASGNQFPAVCCAVGRAVDADARVCQAIVELRPRRGAVAQHGFPHVDTVQWQRAVGRQRFAWRWERLGLRLRFVCREMTGEQVYNFNTPPLFFAITGTK